jgi:hypothetical protein
MHHLIEWPENEFSMTRVHRRPNKKRKENHMKNRNNVFTATLVALAFAPDPGAGAQPQPDGGPSRLPSPLLEATNEATHKMFSSVDFQTCRLVDSPQNRPGVKRALEVGLEIYAAAIKPRDLSHNLSLSFVARCHR